MNQSAVPLKILLLGGLSLLRSPLDRFNSPQVSVLLNLMDSGSEEGFSLPLLIRGVISHSEDLHNLYRLHCLSVILLIDQKYLAVRTSSKNSRPSQENNLESKIGLTGKIILLMHKQQTILILLAII